jgi:hypothetical protein
MTSLQAMVVAGTNALLAGAGLTGPGASGLPSGVVLSLRRSVVTPGGVAFVVALGAFGGVLAKYPPLVPPRPTSPRKPCFIATAALSAEAPEVRVLQRWRDEVLRRSLVGRAFVAGYERLSPPVARYIAPRPALRRAARELLIRPAARAAAAALRIRAGH